MIEDILLWFLTFLASSLVGWAVYMTKRQNMLERNQAVTDNLMQERENQREKDELRRDAQRKELIDRVDKLYEAVMKLSNNTTTN